MDKESIQKYKKEFDSHVNNGEILVWYPDNKFLGWINPDIDEPWDPEDALILDFNEYIKIIKILLEDNN